MAREWRLKARPEGLPGPDCFELAETSLAPLAEGEIRVRNRCQYIDPNSGKVCGRPRGYIRRFGLCRIHFRELALQGKIPGVVKSSW